MSKENLTVRFSRAVMDDIKKLIDEGKYPSYADFVNRAAIELLHREQMEDWIQKRIEEEIGKRITE